MSLAHTPNATAWVLVADHARARLFTVTAPTAPLTEVEPLSNPSEHLREAELVSDRAGHLTALGVPGGYPASPRESAREHAAEVFATCICDKLETERQAGRLARLYLIAEPRFLGLLRGRMGRSLSALVITQLDRDLISLRPAAIRSYLPTQL